MILKIKDIAFSKDSVCDTFGRVFFYQDKIYRLINNSHISDCLELINSELFKKLTDLSYIVKTEIVSDFKIESYDLILQHQKVSDNQPNEWSFLMYKDAALLILKINNICNEYGYELKDAHPYNVVFNNGTPIFIDIGSIQKRGNNESWIVEKEYLYRIYFPLLLWEKGEYFLLRAILDSHLGLNRIIPSQDIELFKYINEIVDNKEYFYFPRKNNIRIKTISKNNFLLFRIINKIIRLILFRKNYNFYRIERRNKIINVQDIEKLEKKEHNTSWGNYHVDFAESDRVRFNRIIDLINELCRDAQTVIDLAGNQGIFSILLEKLNKFEKITMVDYDENAIDAAYSYIKKNGKKVIPLLLNWMIPANLESTTSRLCSDVVVALAVTHHLILSQNFSINAIFERLRMYSKKYVVVEFMPLGLWDGTTAPEFPAWYNQNWFKINFEYYFEILHIEQLGANRIVFFGKKK